MTRAVFTRVPKVIHVICFGSTLITMRHDWFKKLVALCHPVRSNLTKTNRFHALYVKLELHVFMSSFEGEAIL